MPTCVYVCRNCVQTCTYLRKLQTQWLLVPTTSATTARQQPNWNCRFATAAVVNIEMRNCVQGERRRPTTTNADDRRRRRPTQFYIFCHVHSMHVQIARAGKVQFLRKTQSTIGRQHTRDDRKAISFRPHAATRSLPPCSSGACLPVCPACPAVNLLFWRTCVCGVCRV